MNENDIITPSIEEIKQLLNICISNSIIKIQNVGELINMKWVDSYLPTMKGVPKWGYDGLCKFFSEYGIEYTNSPDDALKKLE